MEFRVEIGVHTSRHLFQFGVNCLFQQVYFVLLWLVDLYWDVGIREDNVMITNFLVKARIC